MKPASLARPLCVISGAQGYLGGCLTRALLIDGWRVLGLSRRPPDVDAVPGLTWSAFELGQYELPAEAAQADALIHCAYDFTPRRWPEIMEHNVIGTARLFAAAKKIGVRKVVLISSMSAYSGCRSMYGRAKLAAEEIARQHGALIVRPGLIYGTQPAGMFGRLVSQVQQSRLTPIFSYGKQVLYLVHEIDLAKFLIRNLRSKTAAPIQAVTAAHPQRWFFRDILAEIAGAHGRRLIFISIPWRPFWLALKLIESVGLRFPFTSDSLLSLMYQDDQPDFTVAERAGFVCRSFSPPAQKAQ